jgi:anti-sigma factor RsiW
MREVSVFESKDCGRIQKLLDHFLAGELTVETNQEILLHLENCSTCRQEEKSRLEARRVLSKGWVSQPIPPDLEDKIVKGLEAKQGPLPASLLRAAGFFLMVLGLGAALLFFPWLGENGGALMAGTHYDQIVGDHLHCSGHQTPAESVMPLDSVQPSLEAALHEMGESYQLVAIRLCRVGEVALIHYVFEGEGRSMSLLLEEKSNLQHLALQGDEPARVLDGMKVILLEEDQALITLAGLETSDYFVYLVSEEEEPGQTFQLAEELIPSLKAAL